MDIVTHKASRLYELMRLCGLAIRLRASMLIRISARNNGEISWLFCAPFAIIKRDFYGEILKAFPLPCAFALLFIFNVKFVRPSRPSKAFAFYGLAGALSSGCVLLSALKVKFVGLSRFHVHSRSYSHSRINYFGIRAFASAFALSSVFNLKFLGLSRPSSDFALLCASVLLFAYLRASTLTCAFLRVYGRLVRF